MYHIKHIPHCLHNKYYYGKTKIIVLVMNLQHGDGIRGNDKYILSGNYSWWYGQWWKSAFVLLAWY